MTWPPQSPNLNTIEIIWDELDHRVKKKQPKMLSIMIVGKPFHVKLVEKNANSVQSCHQGKGWLFEESQT
jgi:hypothetical protein